MRENDIQLELYQDAEVQSAVRELFSNQKFVAGMQDFLPAELSNHILAASKEIQSIFDFQKDIVYPFLKFIEKGSIRELSAKGLENLNPQEKYLFISNHRDIGLDSAYLNLLLFENGMETSQIAIGDNLMTHRIAELIFRINKSFVIKRSGTPRELYSHSIRLSNYIHQLIGKGEDSVWIAQREGRAKDGNDRTQIGLLKMLSLSKADSLKTHFQQLKVVPVAISYEIDPCALLKTQEYLQKQADPNYQKSFTVDLHHILLGLKGHKGRVVFHFGKPLDEALNVLDSLSGTKKQFEELAVVIDRSIHQNYELHPINYVAYDLLKGASKYTAQYSPEEWTEHTQYFQNLVDQLPSEGQAAGREYLLLMYANPVVNAEG